MGGERMSRVTASASGAVASFRSPGKVPIRGLKVNFSPVQSGSGDPSPSNVRPITGWTGVNAYHYGSDPSDVTTLPVTFPSEAGTVYGGSVDLVTGELTVDRQLMTLNGSEDWSEGKHTDSHWRFNTTVFDDTAETNQTNKLLSNYAGNVNNTSTSPFLFYLAGGSKRFAIFVSKSFSIDTLNEFKTYLSENPMQIVYFLATPLTYTLTPQQLSTLIGTNNIYSDADSVEVTYDLAESAEMMRVRKRIMAGFHS